MAEVLQFRDQHTRLREAVEVYAERLVRNAAPEVKARFVATFTAEALRLMHADRELSPRLYREIVRRFTQELAP